MSVLTEQIYKKLKENRDAVFLPKKGDQLPLFSSDDMVQNVSEDHEGTMG